jgi:hypothetical protein
MSKECPYGGTCASFGGQGVCIPAAGLNDPCDPEFCSTGTICVGSSADDATCKLRCDADPGVCPDGTTCTGLVGSGAMACL